MKQLLLFYFIYLFIFFLVSYAIWEKLGSTSTTAFHEAIVFLTTVLLALVGVRYQSSDKVLNTHGGTMLLFIMAEFVYSIAFVVIKLLPQNSDYLPTLNLICFISGLLGWVLLLSTLISPFWSFLIPLCALLIIVVPCLWHKQIYKYLCHTTNLLFKVGCDLFQHIYQIALPVINILCDWSQEIFFPNWLYPMFQAVCQALNWRFWTHNMTKQEHAGVPRANNV